jgi:predicted TPR repeat methyltransferase
VLAPCNYAIEVNPADADAYFVRGEIYEKAGKLDRAVRDRSSRSTPRMSMPCTVAGISIW